MKENPEIRKKWIIEHIEKIHSEGMSYVDIAKKWGKSTQQLNNIKNGKSVVGEKLISNFCDTFDININSLFSQYKIYEITDEKKINVVSEKESNLKKTDVTIPLIPIDAAAGFGKGDLSVMETDLIEQYVIPDFTRKGVKFLIRVSGSSMYPKYSNGDMLACRPITDLAFFQWGKVYVLDTDQGALVKRLFEGKSDEYIECRSDNKENYPPFQLPKTSIRSISIVVGVVRLE